MIDISCGSLLSINQHILYYIFSRNRIFPLKGALQYRHQKSGYSDTYMLTWMFRIESAPFLLYNESSIFCQQRQVRHDRTINYFFDITRWTHHRIRRIAISRHYGRHLFPSLSPAASWRLFRSIFIFCVNRLFISLYIGKKCPPTRFFPQRVCHKTAETDLSVTHTHAAYDARRFLYAGADGPGRDADGAPFSSIGI